MAISPKARLLAGGIHLGGLVGVIGFAYWFAMAWSNWSPLVCMILLAVALTTYLIMRRTKRPRSFLIRQLTCAAGIQTLSLLVPVVFLVVLILPMFGVPGFDWFDSKLGLIERGPFAGWGLYQVVGPVGGGVVALLAIGAAVRAFRGRETSATPPAVRKHGGWVMTGMRLGAMACFALSALTTFADRGFSQPMSPVMLAIQMLALVAGVILLVYESKTPKQFVGQAVFFLLLIAAVIPASGVVLGLIHQNYLMALNSLIGLAVVTGSALFVRGRILAASKG